MQTYLINEVVPGVNTPEDLERVRRALAEEGTRGLGSREGPENCQTNGRSSTGMSTKYIFVTGGVVSSLGKGLASAAIGRLDGGARLLRQSAEAGPLHQRRSGHDEPVPAWRGVRHRRRQPRPISISVTTSASPARACSRQTTSPPGRSTSPSSRRSGRATTSARRCR